MSNKKIFDSEGQSVAWMLNTNSNLRKLDLNTNCLGPKTAVELGKALECNTTLKYLDLSNNQLTVDGQDFFGIVQLI